MAKKQKKTKSKSSGPSKAWLLLLVLLVGGVGVYTFLKPTRVLVPNLVGMAQAEAEDALKGLNLQVVVTTAASRDPEIKPNQVLNQTPAPQTPVPVGTVVTLTVAEKPVGIEIPDVVGKTRSEAEDEVRRLGLEVSFKEASSNKVEIGKVISQEPAAGPSSLQKGDMVVLTISGGRGEQTVPDLVELTPAVARQNLKELGLEIVVMQVAQPGFLAGDIATVLRQEPSPGSKLPVGSRVTVFVPIPVPPLEHPDHPMSTTLHAPRLEGMTLARARELAEKEGIVVELAESAEESAVITFQDPPPGDPLPTDSPAVVVRTSSSAVVPGLSGMSEKQARVEIEKADLVVGSVRKSYGPVAGEVLGQRPSAGIEVLAGSSVDLVIAEPGLSPDAAQVLDPLPTPAFTPAPWVD